MSQILVINGPNLNLLGQRETNLYGEKTLHQINVSLNAIAENYPIKLSFFQSNAEHELIDKIHSSRDDNIQYIIFNPAAFTHTSIALRDALLAVKIPFIEVHISDINKREEFRKTSYFSDIAFDVICGLGPDGYCIALTNIIKQIESN